jgi:hypothetical protein
MPMTRRLAEIGDAAPELLLCGNAARRCFI